MWRHQKQRVRLPQTWVETSETKSKCTSDTYGEIQTKSKGTSDMCGDTTNKEQPCMETSQNKELEVPEPCVGESETKSWRYLRYVWINHKQDHTVEVSEIRVETSETELALPQTRVETSKTKSWRYKKL